MNSKVVELNNLRKEQLPFIYSQDIAKKTADFLIASQAYLVNLDLPQEEYYTWKSGVRAPVYCNCRTLTKDGEISKRIGNYFTELIEEKFPDVDNIVGIASAGISWASRVANNLGKPLGYVRSSAKEHGIPCLVEGISEGSAVVLDDLIAGGGSFRKAIDELNKAGIEVVGGASIINWGFKGMYENLFQNIPSLYALTSYPHLLEAAQNNGKISEIERKHLEQFYKDPVKFDFAVMQ